MQNKPYCFFSQEEEQSCLQVLFHLRREQRLLQAYQDQIGHSTNLLNIGRRFRAAIQRQYLSTQLDLAAKAYSRAYCGRIAFTMLNTFPREVRDMVYGHLVGRSIPPVEILRDHGSKGIFQPKVDDSHFEFGPFHTSRNELSTPHFLDPKYVRFQVSREAAEVFYRQVHFLISHLDDMNKFLKQDIFGLGFDPKPHIRQVYLRISFEKYRNSPLKYEEIRENKVTYENLDGLTKTLLSFIVEEGGAQPGKADNRCKGLQLRVIVACRELSTIGKFQDALYLPATLLPLFGANFSVAHERIKSSDPWFIFKFDEDYAEWRRRTADKSDIGSSLDAWLAPRNPG